MDSAKRACCMFQPSCMVEQGCQEHHGLVVCLSVFLSYLETLTFTSWSPSVWKALLCRYGHVCLLVLSGLETNGFLAILFLEGAFSHHPPI